MPVKNALVAGGAGLIGSFLVEDLVSRGYAVSVIDDFSRGRRENLRGVISSIEIREGDLEDREFARQAFAGSWDYVFHLASRAYGVGYSDGHHLEVLDHNERVTNNVFDALRAHRPGHVLVASSSCVHRDDGPDTTPELPIFDGEPELVNWGYGWGKRFLEQKSVIFSKITGVPVTRVRPFNIYGERYVWMGEASQAVPTLVKRVMDGHDPVVIWGSGNQRRNYIHSSDCARVMVDLAETGFCSSPVNIGGEKTVSIADLVQLILAKSGMKSQIMADPSKPEGRFVKSSDTTLLRKLLPKYEEKVSLQDGIEKMIGWYLKSFK
jgi:nucleoside-diphosphate-sugar epimerase